MVKGKKFHEDSKVNFSSKEAILNHNVGKKGDHIHYGLSYYGSPEDLVKEIKFIEGICVSSTKIQLLNQDKKYLFKVGDPMEIELTVKGVTTWHTNNYLILESNSGIIFAVNIHLQSGTLEINYIEVIKQIN
ncbi:hypothetical protein HOD29_05090 [archaeon]|nr:hypothetical protein [archaeon]